MIFSLLNNPLTKLAVGKVTDHFKHKAEKVKTIMNISIQICGILTLVCEPFLPNTSNKLKEQFNIINTNWNSINKNNPIISTKIKKSSLIFRKIEDEEIDFQLQKLQKSKR